MASLGRGNVYKLTAALVPKPENDLKMTARQVDDGGG